MQAKHNIKIHLIGYVVSLQWQVPKMHKNNKGIHDGSA
jgi:hypothetical protein